MKKMKLIRAFEMAAERNEPNWRKRFFEEHSGVNEDTMRKWKREPARSQIFKSALDPNKKIRESKLSWEAIQKKRKGKYPIQEKKLFNIFCERREEGYRCHRRWFQARMKLLLRKDQPVEFEKFKCSNFWFEGFKVRYQVSLRAANNKKSKSVEQRLPQIRKFHQTVKEFRQPPPQMDPKYGRFPANRTYHVDQVPLEFGGMFKKTYDRKGKKSIRIKGTKFNLDKRQATLQPCFCAEGPQNVNPGIIFRITPQKNKKTGTVNSKVPTTKAVQKEFKLMKRRFPNVNVYAQKKAWADSNVVMNWLKDYKKESGSGEKLLGLDNLGAQCSPEFKEAARKTETLLIYTPEDCTDACAVTDAGPGRSLKNDMKNLFYQHYENNPDLWDKDGLLSASDRRMLFVQWLSESWEKMKNQRQGEVTNAFQRCGMLNSIDGSEDHLIKVQGYDGKYSLDVESENEDDSDDSESESGFEDPPLEESESDSDIENE
jgi:hypothetical protein